MWFLRLGLLSRLQPWRTLPFLAALALFLVFMYWEGYLVEAGPDVWLMYAAMAALGFLVSSRRSAEWNLSLVVGSISLGGFMELLGFIGGVLAIPLWRAFGCMFRPFLGHKLLCRARPSQPLLGGYISVHRPIGYRKIA